MKPETLSDISIKEVREFIKKLKEEVEVSIGIITLIDSLAGPELAGNHSPLKESGEPIAKGSLADTPEENIDQKVESPLTSGNHAVNQSKKEEKDYIWEKTISQMPDWICKKCGYMKKGAKYFDGTRKKEDCNCKESVNQCCVKCGHSGSMSNQKEVWNE